MKCDTVFRKRMFLQTRCSLADIIWLFHKDTWLIADSLPTGKIIAFFLHRSLANEPLFGATKINFGWPLTQGGACSATCFHFLARIFRLSSVQCSVAASYEGLLRDLGCPPGNSSIRSLQWHNNVVYYSVILRIPAETRPIILHCNKVC